MIHCHCGDPAEFINTDNGCKANRVFVCSSCLFLEPDLIPLRLVAAETKDPKIIHAVKKAVIEILLNTGVILKIKEDE